LEINVLDCKKSAEPEIEGALNVGMAAEPNEGVDEDGVVESI
jgi:hypothetical protein